MVANFTANQLVAGYSYNLCLREIVQAHLRALTGVSHLDLMPAPLFPRQRFHPCLVAYTSAVRCASYTPKKTVDGAHCASIHLLSARRELVFQTLERCSRC